MTTAPRTRFAPSPTGHVHIGNIRAALFNWLYARHEGGQFLLRIEDTDRERSTEAACKTTLEVMDWLGLNYDEEPLYQSTRMEAHLAIAEELLQKGHAYKEDKGGTGQGEAVVFRMPGEDMSFHDEVKGDLAKKADDMKDFVIVRSNGTPVFHLANVVDDAHMNVTHVIRGDDHVENTFRHIALYRAIGADLPAFAHLPMIVNHQGKPYSKRDGDAYVGDFRDKGYLADALFNYLALLGWSPGDDREVMSREEMTQLFSLDRVQSSAAQMDMKKLQWMNGEYMRATPPEDYKRNFKVELERADLWKDDIDDSYLTHVCELMIDRIKLLPETADMASFFFTEDFHYDEKAVRKRIQKEGALELLAALAERFAALDPFTVESSEAALRALADERGENAGALIHPVRVAVSGLAGGPSLFDMLELLGKDRVVSRMKEAAQKFGT